MTKWYSNKCFLLSSLLIALFSVSCSSTKKIDDTAIKRELPHERSIHKKSESSSFSRKKNVSLEAPDYQEEIDEILSLARRDRWSEAEEQAAKLLGIAPNDRSVLRVYTWVKAENSTRKDRELENKLRDISASASRTNPGIKEIFTSKKTEGLQPRSDLRETLEEIKNAQTIPETFGKVIEAQETMEDLDSARVKMKAILQRNIRLKLASVTLEVVLNTIAQQEKINFIYEPGLAALGKTLKMDNITQDLTLGEFLNYLTRNFALQFQVGSDLIWISDGTDPAQVANIGETRFYRLKKGFIKPAQFGAANTSKTTTVANGVTTISESAVYENFVQDGAAVQPSIESVIAQFFTGSKYYIDYERNVIVAKGTYSQLSLLEDIIKEFDRPVQQVRIEAKFITVTEASFLQLGVDWTTAKNTTANAAKDFTGMGSAFGLGSGMTWVKSFGSNDDVTAVLYAIEQSGESETLSSPSLTLFNNLPAKIEDGQIQYYYSQYTVSQQILENRSSSTLVPSGSPTKITSGVNMDVLASIGGDGETILLALNPTVNSDVKMTTFSSIKDYNSSGELINSFDIKLPEMNTQSLSTRVAIRSGQTVALGGVMQRNQQTFSESVPVLSSIPLIGNLFRKRSEVDKPRYLLIFVKATIMNDSGELIVPKQ